MKVVSDHHTVSSNIYCINTKNGWIPCPSLIINHAPTTLYPIQIRTLLSFSSSFSRPHERIHFLPQYNNYNMGNLHTTLKLKPLRSQPRTDVSMIEIPWRLWSSNPPKNPQKPLKNPSEKQAIKVRWLWYLIADDLHHGANNLTVVTVKLSKGCQQLFFFVFGNATPLNLLELRWFLQALHLGSSRLRPLAPQRFVLSSRGPQIGTKGIGFGIGFSQASPPIWLKTTARHFSMRWKV